jgi:hypothetical protein
MDIIYPEHSVAGKLSHLSTDPDNPETRITEGLAVLRDWIRDLIYYLNPSRVREMLQLFLVASVRTSFSISFNTFNECFPGYRSLRSAQIL